MKTLVLGDIHGRDCWKDIIKKENPDLTIFLGDYVGSHEGISAETQLNNLIEILEYKEENSDSVILLRGNHDVQHLTDDRKCSCYEPVVSRWMTKKENFNRFIKDTQWIYINKDVGDDIIFAHGGITEEWLESLRISNYDEINDILINNYSDLIPFEFTPSLFSDTYGTSPTQPCTWIRPINLLFHGLQNKTFVVGHTRLNYSPLIQDLYEWVKNNIPDEFLGARDRNTHIWTCDALPGEYLVIENKNFIPKYNYIEDDQKRLC